VGLDLWFREDVARILAATQETMQSSQAATVINEDYQLGFRDALRAVAVAFGVVAPSPVAPPGLSRRMQVLDMDDLGCYERGGVWPPRNGGRD
jgi:hypothetical protein